MIPFFPVMLVSVQLAIPVADGVPKLDVRPSCRAMAAGAAGLKQDLQVCINGENAAREQIVAQWGSFAAADRSICVSLSTAGGGATYTELLTCLEMMRDARKLPKEDTIGLGGVMR